VLVGRATRIQRHLMALPKAYTAEARLGWTSTTGDPEGEVAQGRVPLEPLELPTGTLMQRPPAYSAVQVGGVRAYAAARAGTPLELAEREVRVARSTSCGATAIGSPSRSSARRGPTCGP
jgi:tRNA pseudouridine55 synthase